MGLDRHLNAGWYGKTDRSVCALSEGEVLTQSHITPLLIDPARSHMLDQLRIDSRRDLVTTFASRSASEKKSSRSVLHNSAHMVADRGMDGRARIPSCRRCRKRWKYHKFNFMIEWLTILPGRRYQ